MKLITLKEYVQITAVKKPTKDKFDEADFEELRIYNNLANSGEKNFNIFKVNPVSKTITAQDYVGYIQTKSGLGLEILPKVDLSNDEDNAKTKEIFLKMLQAFFKFKAIKELKDANLKLEKMSILEALIAMFLAETDKLLKHGIKKGYETIEDNLPVWKGKLLFSENIRYNFADKSRFYMQFDEYTANRPENKLLKSCLKFLLKASNDDKNQQKIRQQLAWFSEVVYSTNYDKDLNRCQKNRLLKRYYPLLDWCRVFLKHKSFSSFSGTNMAISLLFPMEEIFEAYIAWCLKEYKGDFKFTAQSTSKDLCTENDKNIFQLKPDLKLEKNGETTILDTKWKKLEKDKSINKYGIDQKDLYQLFAYSRVFKSQKVFLIYPKNKDNKDIYLKFNVLDKPECICYCFDLSKCLDNNGEQKETEKLLALVKEPTQAVA